jgi:coenzyme PQQ synthesis protein D (PqqD)
LATDSFRIDPQDVIHETIDGEVILIAVETGVYYSLEASGAEVWAGLLGGRSAQDIMGDLERRYDAPPGAIAKAVSELVEELLTERLVRRAVPQPSGNGAPAAIADVEPGGKPFAPPVLRKFTDMQDFLLVDPVHEVDDAGWPHPATFTR